MKPQNTYRNVPKEQHEASEKKASGWRLQWNNNWLLRMLPYIVYVAFFGIIYIANRHYTERMVRRITKLKKEVEELRIDYTTLNASFMRERNEDNILQKAESIGLGERKKTQYKVHLEE